MLYVCLGIVHYHFYLEQALYTMCFDEENKTLYTTPFKYFLQFPCTCTIFVQ